MSRTQFESAVQDALAKIATARHEIAVGAYHPHRERLLELVARAAEHTRRSPLTDFGQLAVLGAGGGGVDA